MSLADMTSPDVGALAPVLAIAVGSCEQHGPHLPLGTDTMIAGALCERLAARLPGVIVGPTIGVTASGEHAGFAGTLSIGADVTERVLVELARSADWAAGLVLVNGHGGNLAAVERAARTIRSEGRRILSWWPSVADGDAHAGRTETSLMLALRPELVLWQRLEVGETRPAVELLDELSARGVLAVSRNGVLGDPTAATLEEGVRLLDRLTDDLVASVEHFTRSTQPDRTTDRTTP